VQFPEDLYGQGRDDNMIGIRCFARVCLVPPSCTVFYSQPKTTTLEPDLFDRPETSQSARLHEMAKKLTTGGSPQQQHHED